MEFCFLPKNLTPNGASCTISIICEDTLLSVRWCEIADYPVGLTAVPGNIIQVNKNGLYSIELTTKNEVLTTEFSVCHLKQKATFAGGDGSAASPYLIENCAQFNRIRRNLSAHYRLIADLHFEKEMQNICWLPIGKYSSKDPKIDPNIPLEEQDLGSRINYGFTGELDGNGHTIYGLTCQHPKIKQMGIFGSCGYAYIHHLKIEDCIFGCSDFVVAAVLSGSIYATKIERCIVKNVSVFGYLSAGLVGAVYSGPSSVINACQFEGNLYGTGEDFSCLGGLVESTYGFDCDTPVRIENCCVKANLENCGTCSGILNNRGKIRKCFFRGKICSLRRSAGIQDGNEHGMVVDCVCAATQISYKKDVPISQPWDREQLTVQKLGTSEMVLGTGVIKHGWMNFAGRIQIDDFTLRPRKKFMNYCTASCKLLTGTGEHPAIEGSLRDGVTISDEQARDPDFYRSIGWDFDTVWEMGEDGYPQIISP